MVTLDKYIWQGVASWLRERINRELRVVPISLNVSRVDILACDVAEHMGGALAAQYNLPQAHAYRDRRDGLYGRVRSREQTDGRCAQGFLYYRPMPAKDFEVLLDGGNNN